jgi:ABC-type uncharacterized transport system substrate-binding protein
VSAALTGCRALFTCGLFATIVSALPASADQPSPAPRIGVLDPQGASPFEEYLRKGLRELGYAEGQNITIEWRRGAATQEEMRAQAADLARLNVDLIVAIGSPATRAALEATAKPIVMQVGDPVLAGFAASLARPGGRATGVSIQTTDLNQKRLELLRQLAPHARRVVYLNNLSNPLAVSDLAEMQKSARTLGVKLLTISASNDAEIDAALQALRKSAADGVVVTADLTLLANRAKVARAVREAKLPAVFPFREYHDVGALMSYSPNQVEVFRRAATYVDRILKGANPAELPIEQISTYEVVIDARIAREMHIKVPQELLYRADEVIQ